MIKFFTILLGFLWANISLSQDLDTLSFFENSPESHKGRITTVGLIEGVGYTSTMVGLNSIWYKNYPRSGFHFFNDDQEWLYMDKVGHFYTNYTVSIYGINALRWAGAKDKHARIYGGGLGILFQSSIEVLDGFSEEWGFSKTDFAANLAGGALAIGQDILWREQRIQAKYSMSLSPYAQYRPELLGSSFLERMVKDYNGSTYWLSVNMSSFQTNKQSKFPKWLSLSVGYGADGLLGGHENPVADDLGNPYPSFKRVPQYYLSLDVDFYRLKMKPGFWRTLLRAASFIKVPAPTVEFRSGNFTKFHWIYF